MFRLLLNRLLNNLGFGKNLIVVNNLSKTPYNFINNFTNKKNISFQAGITTLYSDFDGTYMPISHNDACNNEPLEKVKKDKLNNNFNEFKKFEEIAGCKFNFIITTGRNVPEFTYFIKKIKDKGVNVPLPAKLIIRDGGDLFTKENEKYIKPNQDKREEIEKLSRGWNGKSIRKHLKSLLKNIKNENDEKLLILSSPVNKHEYDFGDISLEHKLKTLNLPKKNFFASFREDGDLSFHIAFSPNVETGLLKQGLDKYLKNTNLNAKVDFKDNDYDSIVPQFENQNCNLTVGKGLTLKPVLKDPYNYEEKTLSKLYDVRKKVHEIIANKSNDLVIVAGDGSNDEEMLNPFNYVDIIGLPAPKNKQEAEKDLKDNNYRKKLQELPLVSIIVGDNPSLGHIKQYSDPLNENGKLKIIKMDEQSQTLTESIKNGIKSYSNQNNEFKTIIIGIGSKSRLNNWESRY